MLLVDNSQRKLFTLSGRDAVIAGVEHRAELEALVLAHPAFDHIGQERAANDVSGVLGLKVTACQDRVLVRGRETVVDVVRVQEPLTRESVDTDLELGPRDGGAVVELLVGLELGAPAVAAVQLQGVPVAVGQGGVGELQHGFVGVEWLWFVSHCVLLLEVDVCFFIRVFVCVESESENEKSENAIGDIKKPSKSVDFIVLNF